MATVINYVAAVLFVLVIVLGFTTYISHEDVTRLKAESVELTTKLRSSEANVLLAQKSCQVTQEITANVSKQIDIKQTDMTKTLEALATVTTTLQESSNDPKKYADDARLSPALMGLLDAAYCSATSNTSCSTK